MKKSIALLAVLGFIIIIIGLSTGILKLYEKFSSTSYSYISQNSLILKNIKKTLNNALKEINNSDIQNIFTTYPPIVSKDENFILNIEISPVNDKININNLIENNKTNIYILNTLSNILEYYEILDPLFFEDLLLDTLDLDTLERDAYSEIILYKEFQNGTIYNYKHFKEILDYYANIKNDKNIYKIPWDKYIFFGDKKKYILDCNLIDKNLAKFIGLEFKNDIISCENLIENNLTQNLNIKPFDKNNSYLIKVDTNYFLNNQKYNLSFFYNTKTKKAIVENNFIY